MYLLFTKGGRDLRRQVGPALDELAQELNRLRLTVQKAAGVANRGWRLLNAAMDYEQNKRYPTVH